MTFWKNQNPIEHLSAMRRYARALSGRDESADDIVQDALVRAYEGASSFRSGTSLRNWLLTIVRNCFLGEIRRRKADDARHLQLAETLADQAAPDQESQAYLGQVVSRFLQLPDTQREVLFLISIEGMSYLEAAELLDVPIGTVMSRLSRARATLRTIEVEAEVHALRHLRLVGNGNDD